MKNKYVLRSKISEAKFRQLVRCFALDLDARQTSALTGLNRNTVNRYYLLIRQRIAEFCERESPFSGEIEVDESYFGGKRIKGKRGRGAYGKTPVFGIFQRKGKVYTEVVPDCAKATLQAIIRGRVDLDSIIHSDGWRGYNGLVDLGYKKHYRVQHGQNEFARGRCHINGIESFWSFAKRRLMKFHGVPGKTFYLHLKECEFRFNYRGDELYAIILKTIRENPLN
jgi:transposase-like protein